METNQKLDATELSRHTIKIHEPFAEFLQGDDAETNFELSLLDVVRFAGHACPSMAGAFLIAKRAVDELYPETRVCPRGDLTIDLATGPMAGATGPMANVFGYLTGAWGETGFGGLRGNFARRGLLRFESEAAPLGGFRFTRRSTGQAIDLFYDPSQARVAVDPAAPFQAQWRQRIAAILREPERCIWVEKVSQIAKRSR